MKNLFKSFLIIVSAIFVAASCGNGKTPYTNVQHPDWSADAVIYEVNLRQFTPEGTIKAFDGHLDRLAELGVDILWFMPVHPIGILDRKGELGSYYSVKDYKDINPEFGNLEDFGEMVKKAHSLGMKVILDWVANHTSRDNGWIEEHPDWYVRDSAGVIIAPSDWTDVAKLDYGNRKMRDAMIDALSFWVETYDIDGYRCDVAGLVPVDFWEEAFAHLKTLKKDLFFLSEAENPVLNENAFDAYYGWDNHKIMNRLARGEANAEDYMKYLAEHDKKFPQQSIQMNFTSNHDENSWKDTEFARMGDAARQFAAFTFVIPGMPLIYSGQEVGSKKALKFFERDPIEWNDEEDFTGFYKNLIAMRDAHPSMYAPRVGAPMKILRTSEPENIFAFERKLKDDGFTAIFNFSAEEIDVEIEEGNLAGKIYKLSPHGYEIIF